MRTDADTTETIDATSKEVKQLAEVKWIKIVTDIFDDTKILLIEKMPDAYAIIVVWFKLLCLAGKENNGGVFRLNEQLYYTDEMLSSIFRMSLNTIRLALSTFEKFGMIEIIEGVITIPNWEKHQSVAKLESIREYNRIAKQKERVKKKLLLSDGQGQVNDSQDTDIDIDIEVDKDIDIDNKNTGDKSPCHYSEIQNLYSSICISYPKLTKLSDARKKAIKARFSSGYTIDDFKRLFETAEKSEFLKGKNNRNWQATFDWLLKDANMAKVLDGNYSERGDSGGTTGRTVSEHTGDKPKLGLVL